MKNDIWVMRDGTEINVRDMADSHLINSINMLKRNAFKLDCDLEKYDEWFSFHCPEFDLPNPLNGGDFRNHVIFFNGEYKKLKKELFRRNNERFIR